MNTDTTKLDRILRLQGVLINAGAIPLPVDLMPSALPQPLADANETIQERAAASPPSDETAAGPVTQAGHEPIATEPAHDAVLSSLQTAREAIHDSLHPDLPVQAAELAADAAPQETAAPVALPQEAAATSAAPVVTFTIPDERGGASPLTSAALPGPADHEAPTGTPLDASASVASALHPLLNAVEPLATDVAGTLVNDAAPVVETIDHAAITVLTDVTQAATQILPAATTVLADVTQAATQVLPAVTQVLEAVTVPSLQGTGLDALTGLLQPPAQSPAHAVVDSAVSTLDHALIFSPIGLDDSQHAADAGIVPLLHTTLPAAGSGLI